jgi:fluoride ion exporter CrcB/FEX
LLALECLCKTRKDWNIQYLIRPLAVAFGSAVGSALRHTTETGDRAILQSVSSFIGLLIAGGGSFFAGLLSAQTSPLAAGYALIARAPLADIISGFAVGLVGGFAILPAFKIGVDSAPSEAEARAMTLRVVSSLVVSIVFFLLGATFSRLLLAQLL